MARRPVHMKKTALSSRKRAALRVSDFAVPSERKYPINDLFHARLALTYVLSPSNAAYRDEVVRAVMARYPELQFWWAARSKGVEAKRAQKGVRRAASGRRMVANPHDEWMDEDELAREQERKARASLFRKLGPNVGSNADWADPAYALDGKRFLVASEDGTLDIVRRGRWNARDEFYEDETLARFDTAAEAADWLNANGFARKNPRRNPSLVWREEEHPDGLQYVATAPLGVKYVIWGGSEGGGWFIDRERSLHHPYALRSQRTLEAAKEEAEWDAAPYFAARKNPRPEVETEAYFAAMEPTRAKYAERGPEELVLVRSRAAKMLRKFAGKSDREVAKALGLDPRDPAVLRQIALMRQHAVVTNPAKRGTKRTAKRTAAQSNAAKAMRLFHSGQASSLAEAWAMLRR